MDLYHPVLDRTLHDVHPKKAAILARSGWVEDVPTAPEEGDITTDTTSEEE